VKTKITIELEVEGDESEALYVVESLLDNGDLQESINDHAFDVGPLRVLSATAHSPHADQETP
jgi:hypothetical protein